MGPGGVRAALRLERGGGEGAGAKGLAGWADGRQQAGVAREEAKESGP
jgi:hypothetical protein